jgi:hypothetical protein
MILSRVKKSFRRSSSKSKHTMEIASTPRDQDRPSFPQFAILSDDVVRLIVSFMADAPMEQKLPGPIENKYRAAALTSSLPFVNKRFNEMSNADYLWGPALSRQLSKKASGHLWRGGLRRLLPLDFELEEGQSLLHAVLESLGEGFRYKDVYMKLLERHIKIEAPVFIMPCQLQLGEMYGLHLFEPRYRIMVREVLDDCENPEESMRGGKIVSSCRDGFIKPPLLIHACMGSRLGPGQLACLVQIVWCRTYEFGTADVQLLPVAWVKLDEISVRPNSGHLFCAKGTRI